MPAGTQPEDDEENPFDIETDWELDGAGVPLVTGQSADDADDDLWGEIEDDMGPTVQSVPTTEDEHSNKSNKSGAGAPSDSPTEAGVKEDKADLQDTTLQQTMAAAGSNAGLEDPALVTPVHSSPLAPTPVVPTTHAPAFQAATVPAAVTQPITEPEITALPEILPEVEDEALSTEEDPSPDAGAGWGWGGGWGLGTIGGTLKAVAAGAVRDVKGLAVSAQQALADVQDESEDESAALLPAGQPAGATAAAGRDTVRAGGPQPAEATGQAEEARGAPPELQEADRSAGGEGGKQSDLEDVDESMDQLATGAAKALSSLWGGLSGVARGTASLVSKVEAATFEIAKELVTHSGVSQDMAQLQAVAASSVRGVAVNVGRIGTRIEASLETVGRTALGLLEEVTGQHDAPAGGLRADSGLGAAQPSTYRSFEELLDLYGGRQIAEDQENLANECARIANRARAKLEEGQQAELDAVMALLGPVFSRPLATPSTDWQADDASRPAMEQLDQRYEPVRFLCRDSATRAHAFKELLLAAAHEDAARITALAQHTTAAPQQEQDTPGEPSDSAPTQVPNPVTGTAQPAAVPDALAQETSAQEKQEEKPSGAKAESAAAAVPTVPATPTSPRPESELDGWEDELLAAADAQAVADGAPGKPAESLLLAALVQVRGHAFKRMAELVTAQLQLLTDHAVNLAAPARSVDVQAGSVISWPPSAKDQAGLVRNQAQQMLQDMTTVGTVYCAAVEATLALLQGAGTGSTEDSLQPGAAEGVEGATPAVVGGIVCDPEALGLCSQVLQQLQAAKQSTCGSLEEAFRSLLFAVLVRELVVRVAGESS